MLERERESRGVRGCVYVIEPRQRDLLGLCGDIRKDLTKINLELLDRDKDLNR